MALLLGLVFVIALGVIHHYGILTVRAIRSDPRSRPQAAIMSTFLGLVVLHTFEIVAFAAAYRAVSLGLFGGGLGSVSDETWGGLIYFSGMNFTTLGFSQIQTDGPLRLISMMQSLGGFMILTWSATFLYSVCERAWKR